MNDPFTQQRLDKFHGFAENQLGKWHEIAVTWKLYLDGFANRCYLCNQCIWFTHDMYGEKYQYSPEEILALITAHIRQVHEQATDARPEMSLQAVQEQGSK